MVFTSVQINNSMNKRQLTQANHEYIGNLTTKCTHGLTLQTNLKTRNISNWQMERHIEDALKAMNEYQKRLNWLLTGNGYKRNPEKLPIIITALEGTQNTYDHNRTLHFHIALGNFDLSRLDDHLLERLRYHWQRTGIGTRDIKLEPLIHGREHGWGTYINKEHNKGNEMCIDFSHTQIPSHLLAD